MAKRGRKSDKPLPEKNRNLLKAYMEANELTKTDIASLLGITTHTLRKALGGKPLIKTKRNKIGLFIKNKKLSERSGVEEMRLAGAKERLTSNRAVNQEIILRIKQFMETTGFGQTDIAKVLELKRSSFQDALYGKSICFENREKVERFGRRPGINKLKVTGVVASVSESIEQRIEKIKHLLLVLESDLRFFKGSKKAREFFRRLLDCGDVGYVASLLTALTGDEKYFERWIESNTYQFEFFKEKG